MRFDRLAQLLIQQNLLLSLVKFRLVVIGQVSDLFRDGEFWRNVPRFHIWKTLLLRFTILPLHYFLAKMELE